MPTVTDPPAGVSPEDWRELRTRFAAHLDKFGHAIYDLDFAKPVPADDPAPLIETLRHLIQGQGSDPYGRQREAMQRREDVRIRPPQSQQEQQQQAAVAAREGVATC